MPYVPRVKAGWFKPSKATPSELKVVAKKAITALRKRYKGRKSYNSKSYNSIVINPRNVPFPASRTVTLKYCQQFVLSSGTAGIIGAEQVFRLNSCHDFDFTGTGHQPYFWDEMKAIYNKYQVMGVRIHATFSDPGADGIACYALLQRSDASESLTLADPSYVRERTLSWQKTLHNTGSQVINFKQHVMMHQLEGLSYNNYRDDDNYTALVSTNPFLTPYLRVAIGSDQQTTGAQCTFKITAYFRVRFWNRNTVAQS